MRRRSLTFLILLLAGACRRSPDPDVARRGAPPPRADGRLPRRAHPNRYALDLVVDATQARFSGRARIDMRIDDPTSEVVMNARGLNVRSATMRAPSSRIPAAIELRRAARSKDDPEELVVAFDRVFAPGEMQIEIEYDAPFATGLRGLYRVQEGGRSYAFTQFEPTDARRVFPCFDEPGFKTPFTMAISVPPGAVALSNMPEVGRRPDGALTRFEFAPSPPLPTYLVALAVGAFDMREGLAGRVPL